MTVPVVSGLLSSFEGVCLCPFSSLFGMESIMADLSLSVEEEEDLIIESSTLDTQSHSTDLCLVGRLLSDRNINFNAMKNRLADLWRPVKGVLIREIGDQKFIFQFFHAMDMRRILEGGPWTFDNQYLILHHLKQGEHPIQIPLYLIPFWVQIYELPVGYISEGVGKQIGNFIGTFLEYDVTNNAGFWRQYMRVRVAVDVRYPLKRCKKIRKPGGDWFIAQFKYERLGSFCFVCGRLGHTERFCEILFQSSDDNKKREWGVWLRAPDKRSVNSKNSKWLREECSGTKDSGVHDDNPTDQGVVAGDVVHYFQNPVFAGKTRAELAGLQSGKESKQTDILRDFRPLLNDRPNQSKIPARADIEDENIGLELNEDRKRRRAAHLDMAHKNNMVLDCPSLNYTMLEKEADHTSITTNQKNGDTSNVHFLLAGPGLQACPSP